MDDSSDQLSETLKGAIFKMDEADTMKSTMNLEIDHKMNESERGITDSFDKTIPEEDAQILTLSVDYDSEDMNFDYTICSSYEHNDSEFLSDTENICKNDAHESIEVQNIHDSVVKRPEISLCEENNLKQNCMNIESTSVSDQFNSELDKNSKVSSDFHKDIEEDVKLKLGCFIKLVDCQVLLKSMIAKPEVTTKSKKRKLSEGINSKKSKIKKVLSHSKQEPKSLSTPYMKTLEDVNPSNQEPTTSSINSHCETNASQKCCDGTQDDNVLKSKASHYGEGKTNSKILSNNDSNIFTNMTSFLFSGGCSEEQTFSSIFVDSPNSTAADMIAKDNFDLKANKQPIVRLTRLPSGHLTKDLQKERQNDCNKIQTEFKVEDETTKEEKIQKECYETVFANPSKKEAHSNTESMHLKNKSTKIRERKSTKVNSDSKPEKSKSKSVFERELVLRKSSCDEKKKVEVDEALKKLQDVISIKPVASQGPIITKRIPKLNQSFSRSTQSKSSSSEMERKNHLVLGTESSKNVQNQLEDAGWTRHSRFSRSDTNASTSTPFQRNKNWDRKDSNYQKKLDFASATQRSPDETSKDDMNESSYNGSSSERVKSSRYSDRYSESRRRKPCSSKESHRHKAPHRPPLLPSPQNFSNMSCDVQFLLKACNAIVENNSNMSSEQQHQFNLACNRLQDELEKLIPSSNSLNSPGSKNISANSSVMSLKDINTEEILSFLKPYLPQDVFEKFNKDVSRLGSMSQHSERSHPISPQSSTSSTSHKDLSFPSHLSPKHFFMKEHGGLSNGAKLESKKMTNQMMVESRLLKKMEKEIQILETLIRVQDQLSSVDNDKADAEECTSTDSTIKINQVPNSIQSCQADENILQCSEEYQSTAKSPSIVTSQLLSEPPLLQDNQAKPTLDQSKDKDKNDLSKDKEKDKKLEDKIIVLSRNSLKSYYHRGNITSDEFRMIMKKAITKISESKCRDVSQPKVSRFIDSLVSNVISKRKNK